MRPAAPAPGDPLLASWAGDVIDFIGSRTRYVPNPNLAGVVQRTYPSGVTNELELTELPANDPTIVAAHVGAMVRDSGSGVSLVFGLYSGITGLRHGFVATGGGVASRGAGNPGMMIPVGGTNGRSIQISGTASDTGQCWVTVHGWWVQDSDEPASGSSDGIASVPDAAAPAAGEAITSDWAAGLLRMAGRGWSFHPMSENNSPNYSTAGTYYWDVSAILPSDPRVIAAAVMLRIRGSDTNDRSITAYDADGTSWAGTAWTTGVASRYAVTGHWPVLLGGARTIKVSTNGTVTDAYAVICGYWTSDSEIDP